MVPRAHGFTANATRPRRKLAYEKTRIDAGSLEPVWPRWRRFVVRTPRLSRLFYHDAPGFLAQVLVDPKVSSP
jgi:hypothetical protein